MPGNSTTTINSIEKYLEDVKRASAGESIGITTKDPVFINRGDLVCLPGKEPVLTDKFHASLFWMTKKDFDKSERLTIRCATQETTCKIEAINKRIDSSTLEVIEEDACILKNLEVAEVVIKTKKPIAIKPFSDVQELGRFVLVEDGNICAGGIITFIKSK